MEEVEEEKEQRARGEEEEGKRRRTTTRVSVCETSQQGEGEEEDAHEVLEVGHAVGVPQTRDVADVDRFGAAAARHEDVGLVAEVRRVAEVGAVGDDVAVCERAIILVSEAVSSKVARTDADESSEKRDSLGSVTSRSSTRTM